MTLKHLINTRTLWLAAAVFMAVVAIAHPAAFSIDPHAAGGLMLANAVGFVELKQIVETIQKGFADFKENNDARLKTLEKGGSDSDFTAKFAKIEADIASALDLKKDLDRIEAKSNRAGLGGKEVDPAKTEYREAFVGGFMRKGDDTNVKSLQAKAMSVGTPADGGYAVPEELDRQIDQFARDVSPMRQICRVVKIGTSDYKKLVNVNGIASGWVGETAARPATGTSQLKEVAPYMGEIYANPQVTQQALDDIFFDVETEVAMQVAEEFAVQEGAGFVNGDGANKPKGILQYTAVATGDATRPFGQLEYLATGVAGDWAAANKGDALFDLVAKLKAVYRTGSNWLMAKAIMFEIMKFKDTTGQYLWQPDLKEGAPIRLLGYSVVEAEDMPAKAANALAVAFGNFQRGYLIADRFGPRMLRDPYTNKPYVGFYTTKRVGGAVVNDPAIKLLKFSAN